MNRVHASFFESQTIHDFKKTSEPLLILDAHQVFWDILMTARWVRVSFHPKRIHMPIAAYLLHIPIIKEIITLFSKLYKITFYPVYRKADDRPITLSHKLLCWFYPKSITKAYREAANSLYLSKIQDASTQKGNIIIISPYGGTNRIGGQIKYGAQQLLQSKITPILSLTYVKPIGHIQTIIHPYAEPLTEAYQKLLRNRN